MRKCIFENTHAQRSDGTMRHDSQMRGNGALECALEYQAAPTSVLHRLRPTPNQHSPHPHPLMSSTPTPLRPPTPPSPSAASPLATASYVVTVSTAAGTVLARLVKHPA